MRRSPAASAMRSVQPLILRSRSFEKNMHSITDSAGPANGLGPSAKKKAPSPRDLPTGLPASDYACAGVVGAINIKQGRVRRAW